MRRCIVILFLFLLIPVKGLAQKDLEFYYIAHDQHEVALTAMLDDVRKNVRYDGNRIVIFYLANGNSPRLHFVSSDDEKEYELFRSELNSQDSHNVFPEVDRQKIIELFSLGEKLPAKGFDAYNRISFNFYVNKAFIDMEWGDEVIGRLYWDMELSALPKGKIQYKVYYPSGDRVNEDKIFGRKKLFGGFEPLVNTF